MDSMYISKCDIGFPLSFSSVSSPATISLISFAVVVFKLGIQGIVIVVNFICKNFNNDIKSQTA